MNEELVTRSGTHGMFFRVQMQPPPTVENPYHCRKHCQLFRSRPEMGQCRFDVVCTTWTSWVLATACCERSHPDGSQHVFGTAPVLIVWFVLLAARIRRSQGRRFDHSCCRPWLSNNRLSNTERAYRRWQEYHAHAYTSDRCLFPLLATPLRAFPMYSILFLGSDVAGIASPAASK